MSVNTVAFFGATGGSVLSALRHALASGTTCIALCRTPAKLAHLLTPPPPPPVSSCPFASAPPPPSTPSDEDALAAVAALYPNLVIKTGNAHDPVAVTACLVHNGVLVDAVLSGVGGRFIMSRMTIDGPHVCARATEALLSSLRTLCEDSTYATSKLPRIVVYSTLGTEGSQRGYPLMLAPMYEVMLRVPHQDKGEMERLLRAEDWVRWTIVRPSLLVDEPEREDKRKEVKWEVDAEDGKCVQKGWTIGRDAVGRWTWERVLAGGMFEHQIVSITC